MNKATTPLVSIVVPVYNSEKFIAETIKSVQDQTYSNWELLLVNDVSTDKSVEIIKELQKKDKRIKLFNNRVNSGAGPSRNRGIKEAKGQYLAFLDADDLWLKTKLAKQVKFMQKNDCAFSFTGYEFADAFGKPNGKKVRVPKTITYKQALKNTTISTITVMFDMSKLSKKKIQMPDLRRGQDTACWWSILKLISYANGLNEVLSYYRRTPETLSANKYKALKRTWYLYRNVENFKIFKSFMNFIFYSLNAARRRI